MIELKKYFSQALNKLVQPSKTPHNGSASFGCLLWISVSVDPHEG